jgi:hypothetical protein
MRIASMKTTNSNAVVEKWDSKSITTNPFWECWWLMGLSLLNGL